MHEHTGLFVERSPRHYGFMHLTFEEYYAARSLVAVPRKAPLLIREHLHDPRWDEPILLALGLVGLDYPDRAIELLETAILAQGEEAEELGFTPSSYEDILGRDYLFALRCLGDQIPADPTLVKELTQRLADELLHQTDSAKFQRYRQTLERRLEYLQGSSAATELVAALTHGLDNDDADVRFQAVQILGLLGQGSPEVVQALIAALADNDADVQLEAAQSLGRLGQVTPEVVEALLDGVRRAESWLARGGCADLLGQIGRYDQETVSVLLMGLTDQDNDVRTACTQALARLGRRNPEATEEIASILLQALDDPKFDPVDSVVDRTGHDHAVDALWMLVVGEQA